MILNLKHLNEYVKYHHFKMESLQSAIHLMTEGCYMASIDLKDAYYSIPVALEHRKFLQFLWGPNVYQYTCLPNGLASAPRIFTKLMKPIYSALRGHGLQSVAYIDDSLLFGDTYEECCGNVQATVQMMTNTGFMIHERKSVFTPTQRITFLGFVLDS